MRAPKVHLADWVKALLLKVWFAGVLCYFFVWGLSSYGMNQWDHLVILGLALGMITNLITNNIYRFMAKKTGAYDRWMMFPESPHLVAAPGYALRRPAGRLRHHDLRNHQPPLPRRERRPGPGRGAHSLRHLYHSLGSAFHRREAPAPAYPAGREGLRPESLIQLKGVRPFANFCALCRYRSLRPSADRGSSPERTIWNIEKIREGQPASWNYIDGCMITALLSLADITGDRAFFDFAESFIDSFVLEDGSIRTYKPDGHTLDDINEGRVLFALYEATGKEKYRLAAEKLYRALMDQPRTFEGSWWHKQIYPNQVWLDGIYMAQPFAALYEKHFGSGDYADVLHQLEIVEAHMRDPKTGLYYHGYDASRKAFWCDPETGLSQNFWLRAIGWFSVALADLLEILPRSGRPFPSGSVHPPDGGSLVPFMDPETGMYYQLVNLPEVEGNYLESSGSSMIAYAMLKGARLGLLDAAYADRGQKTFEGIVRNPASPSPERS